MKKGDVKYMQWFTDQHYELVRRGDHVKALSLLKRELKSDKNDPWLLANIAMSYYDLKRYKLGMPYALKAYQISPKDPLIMHYYSVLLNANEFRSQARDIWMRITKMPIDRIAFGLFGEGLRYARSLRTDVFARIGFSFMADNDAVNGAKFLRKHLLNRRKGQPSTFNRRYVEKHLQRCIEYAEWDFPPHNPSPTTAKRS